MFNESLYAFFFVRAALAKGKKAKLEKGVLENKDVCESRNEGMIV